MAPREDEARNLKMDYDRTSVPAVYDRGRDHGPEVLDLWMTVVESHMFFMSMSFHHPDRSRLCAVSETAGFRCVESHIITQTVAPSWAAYADKLSAGGDSVLATLAEDELAGGLEAIRSSGDREVRQRVVEAIDVFFFR